MSKPKPLDEKLKSRSRELRAHAPIPERLLWGALRGRRLDGFKFRRQVVIAGYIADFVCEQQKLIVELDGMTHVGRGETDDRRTEQLAKAGYRVIRFTNDDVVQSLDAVAEAILRECRDE